MLISEIGNAHFGSMEKAKELIRASIDSGADIIKGQAFVSLTGSMQPEFYEQCRFSIGQYIDLVEYARSLGSDMFFSYFPFNSYYPDLNILKGMTPYIKLSASQTGLSSTIGISKSIISLKKDVTLKNRPANSKILYATDYMDKQPYLRKIIKEDLDGLSDHTMGIDLCLRAIQDLNVQIIEKHFTMKKRLKFKGRVFRDTVHGATPSEFAKIAKAMK